MKRVFSLVVLARCCTINGCSRDVEKPNASQSALQPEQALPTETPLDSKQAAAACGSVLKLDKAAFPRLNLMPRFSQLITDGGFNEAELKAMDLHEEAFSAYSLAYLTWDKPLSRAEIDKLVIHADSSVDKSKFTASDRAIYDAYMVKYKHLMVKAFDLGRSDARSSPCPY